MDTKEQFSIDNA